MAIPGGKVPGKTDEKSVPVVALLSGSKGFFYGTGMLCPTLFNDAKVKALPTNFYQDADKNGIRWKASLAENLPVK